jgi:hypothetical protein
VASINFATDPASQLRTVYTGNVTTTAENLSKFTTYKTQLFRFDLASQSISNNAGVQLSIYDARTGSVVASMASANGLARTEYIWLGAGEYFLRAVRRVRVAATTGPVNFTLRADVISDDQGPLPIDPTRPPETPFPDWDWETLPPTVPPPIINIVIPLPEDPWNFDILLPPIDDYYATFLA